MQLNAHEVTGFTGSHSIKGAIFRPLLRRNVEGVNEISVVSSYVGEQTAEAKVATVQHAGSSYLASSDGPSVAVSSRSIENIVAEYTDFEQTNFLKIDTDAYDNVIIVGIQRWLSNQQPVVSLEYDATHFERVDPDGPQSLLL